MVAVDSADLEIKAGSFYGFVGPNGAGKTTTLSMVTGLLRPDSGVVKVYGADVWRNASVAKRMLGVLPDRLRLFDRLTGAEYLHHSAGLRGLDRETTLSRTADLVNAFGLEHSLHRFVSDYSAGMVKKISIASAMIHSPRLLVLDEPFESVDPVSAQLVIDILKKFTAAGGTVLMSSHSMHLIERICDHVAIIADGRMLASGTLERGPGRALARGPVRRTGRRRDSGGGHGVVAQLLRLKLRLFANGFRRPLWAVIVSGLGLAIAIAVVARRHDRRRRSTIRTTRRCAGSSSSSGSYLSLAAFLLPFMLVRRELLDPRALRGFRIRSGTVAITILVLSIVGPMLLIAPIAWAPTWAWRDAEAVRIAQLAAPDPVPAGRPVGAPRRRGRCRAREPGALEPPGARDRRPHPDHRPRSRCSPRSCRASR